jgi:hypothetical protein
MKRFAGFAIIQKDKVADLLKRQVCDGTLTQKEAQDQITADWHKIELAHH